MIQKRTETSEHAYRKYIGKRDAFWKRLFNDLGGLGASWGPLGVSWKLLGRLLGLLGDQDGVPLFFGLNLGPSWRPCWRHFGPKLG